MAAAQQTILTSTILETDLTDKHLIGSGGSGEVYKVLWDSPERGYVEAAAKQIPRLNRDLAELEKEIRLLQKLKHPNIIEYYGHCVTKDHVIIVTEYATNGSLDEYLEANTRLPLSRITTWATQIAKGIQYLEKKNVVHRDIKPLNILLTADNQLKICDFGISKDLTTTTNTEHPDKGTIRWLAPELFKDGKLSRKADIFAFGVLLWQLVTCEVPYKSLSNFQVLYAVGSNGLRPQIPSNCPPILEDLMTKCWRTDRGKRPSTGTIIREIEKCGSMTQPRIKQTIRTPLDISACHWISQKHLAVCTMERVDVYEVTMDDSQMVYKLVSNDWKGKATRGVAVSESLQDSMLVICLGKPFVYRHPCHESIIEIEKYEIQGSQIDPKPLCIVANSRSAVVGFYPNELVVCSLPDFSQQSRVRTDVDIRDLSITSDSLLVMGEKDMFVKSLDSLGHNLYRIEPPNGLSLQGVCFENDDKLYVGCVRGQNGIVYQYCWNGMKFVNTGYIDKRIKLWMQARSMSVSVTGMALPNGWLAVAGQCTKEVKVFRITHFE